MRLLALATGALAVTVACTAATPEISVDVDGGWSASSIDAGDTSIDAGDTLEALGGVTPGCEGCVSDQCQVATCDGASCTRRDFADGTECTGGVCIAGACVARGCGDTYVEPGPSPAREGCDDGNTVSGDGCSASCEPEILTVATGGAARVPTSVAVDGRGAALALWVAELPTEDARELRAQRFTRMGNPEGAPIVVARFAGLGADVDFASTGRPDAGWAVAWSAAGADRDGYGVRFALASDTGAVWTSEPVSDADGDQRAPAIAWFAGGPAIAYVDLAVPMSHGGVGQVVVRRFTSAGVGVGTAEVVSTPEHPSGEPAMITRASELVLAWSEGPDPMATMPSFESRVVARRRGTVGWSDPAPIVLSDERASSASLAWLDGDSAMAIWTSRGFDTGGDAEAALIGVTGPGALTRFAPERVTTRPQDRAIAQPRAVVASLAQGHWIAAWEENERSPTIGLADPDLQLEAVDLDRLHTAFVGRSAAGVSMMRAPRGVWVVWTDAVVGGRAVRAHLLPYDDLCRLCGETSVCVAAAGQCVECLEDADCVGLVSATASCVSRECVYACDPDRADCSGDEGCEIDTSTDEANCGACGTTCRADQVCWASICQCDAGLTECSAQCVDTTSDASHCGACGVSCEGRPGTTGGFCTGSTCSIVCAPYRADCDGNWANGCEVDLLTSDASCGACGSVCTGFGRSCQGGDCLCGPGMTDCGGVCRYLSTDPLHCGACGNVCPADSTCQASACVCDAGYQECPGESGCFHTSDDPSACGSNCIDCGSLPGALGTCSGGACTLGCGGGIEDCDGNWQNGCETYTWNADTNCGACGNTCVDRPYTTSGFCNAVQCHLTCEVGYGNCDGDTLDGCETNIRTAVAHCGACGNDCRNHQHVAAASCNIASCSYTCEAGWGNCTTAVQGCETELNTASNCGACGSTCDWACGGTSCNDATRISAGLYHSCAIRQTGALVCWGRGAEGRLGNGSTSSSTTPVPVTGSSSGVTWISAGYAHTCAVRNGYALCWGSNDYGQLGFGNTTDRSTPGYVAISSGIAQVETGAYHSCALRTNGTMWCWGYNAYGQLGNGTTTSSTVPVQVTGFPSGTTVVDIALGNNHSCARLSNNTVRCWGLNSSGQLGNGQTTNRTGPTTSALIFATITSIAASGNHSCAVTSTGQLYCWGNNAYGQIGVGSTTNRPSPTVVSGLSSGVGTVSVGAYHTCARLTSGAARCWGYNGYGGVGDGTTTQRTTPVSVWGLSSGVLSVASGGYHSCAMLSGGALRCWGRNNYGQVGDSTWTDRLTRTPVSPPPAP